MQWLVLPSGFCDVSVWMQINSTEANHSEGLFCPWVMGPRQDTATVCRQVVATSASLVPLLDQSHS